MSGEDEELSWQQQAELLQGALDTSLQRQRDLEERISLLETQQTKDDEPFAETWEEVLEAVTQQQHWLEERLKEAKALAQHHYHLWQLEVSNNRGDRQGIVEHNAQILDRLYGQLAKLQEKLKKKDETIRQRDQEIVRLRAMLTIQGKLLQGR